MRVRFILAGLVLCSITAWGEMRIWTSVKGDTVEAEYKAIVSGRVILHKPDGKELKVPLRGLCAADIKYLEAKIPPSIDIDVNVDKDKTNLESYSGYTTSYEREEIKIKCEVTISKKSRDKSSMPLKACILVFSEDTRNKELKVISRTEKEFNFLYNDEITFNSDVAKFEATEYSGYYGGSEHGDEYEGYLVFVENGDGELIAVRGSSKSYEKNIERLKGFKKDTRFDDDYDVIK